MLSPCEKCGAMLSRRTKFCPECGAPHAARHAAPVEPAAPAEPAAPPEPDDPFVALDKKAAQRKRLRRGLLLSTVLAVPFWAAMYFFVFNGDGCSKARGTLTAKALPKAGDLVFAPKLCRSGQHMSFAGVALFAKKNTDPVVTVVRGHLEPAYVLLDPPSCGQSCRVRLTQAECPRFDVVVERTSTTVNDIRLLDGHLRLSCKLPGGGTVEANVRYESCD